MPRGAADHLRGEAVDRHDLQPPTVPLAISTTLSQARCVEHKEPDSISLTLPYRAVTPRVRPCRTIHTGGGLPRKIRDLERDLRRAGFVRRQGKGSHRQWVHHLMPDRPLTMSGSLGTAGRRYRETQIREVLADLERRRNE